MEKVKRQKNVAAKLEIQMGKPVVVTLSPPEEKRWGFYQFPDLWRGNDGKLYLAVNVGADSEAGHHEPSQFFASPDGIRSWKRITPEAADWSPEIIDLPDRGQVVFGTTRRIYHYDALSPDNLKQAISAKEAGLQAVAGPFRDGYKVNEYMVYRYRDIPEAKRSFPMASRPSPEAPWQKGSGRIDFPDMLLGALTRAMWWDDKGKETWLERDHRLKLPIPDNSETVVVPSDGTLVWAVSNQNPKMLDRPYFQVTCLASEDRGRIWKIRGCIANDTMQTTWGYSHGEHSLARMPDGELLCVMRTKVSNYAEDTHYLAASRSKDNGYTWSLPEPIAEFSVTPHLIPLENGVVALIYGRPGVHIRTSADSGKTWTESVPVVGPAETELLAMPLKEWWKIRHDFSCANTTVVVTGPDRFLVAYTDFRHISEDGKIRKSVEVREVVVICLGKNGARKRAF